MKATCILLFYMTLWTCYGQDDYTAKPPRNYSEHPARNAFFLELGGNAGLYSFNYDRLYFYREHFKLSGRVGFAPRFNGFYIEQVYVLEQTMILGTNPHHLEFGVGGTLQRRYNERPNVTDQYFWENLWFSVWRFGYRYQKQDDGFFLRAGATPAVMSHDALGFHAGYFQFWLGVSLGMGF